MRLALVAFFCCMLLASTTARADEAADEAPFGLTWGMSSEAAKAEGIVLTAAPVKEFGAAFSATKVPKVIGDAEMVALFFGYDDKLWRIVAVSTDFSNDPYGNAVKSRFDELRGVLQSKYGKPADFCHRDPNMFTRSDEFLEGIQAGRSWCYSNFDTPSLSIQLAIGAKDMQTGYWRLIFENKALRADFEKGKKAHEKDAL